MPDAISIPCPRCGAPVGAWCPAEYPLKGLAICHDRDKAWQEAGRPSAQIDWKLALKWYMHHVWHDQGTTSVRTGNGMNCMPPEMKKAIQEAYFELESMQNGGRRLKPDGSEY